MKKSIFKVSGLLFGLLVLLCTATASADSADVEAELQSHIEVFQGSNFQQQRKVIDQLAWAGIADERLFDVIASKLSAAKVEDNKTAADRASWYAKALARSGNEKYKSNLQSAASDANSKKTRKHAQNSIAILDQYKVWNPKIAAGVVGATKGRLIQHRITNMLNDSDTLLMRIGAKRVYWAHSDDQALVAVAADRLKREYDSVESKDQVDAVAWLIKGLAQSGDAANKGLLTEIASSASNKKVRKYAKKYADYL